MHHHSLPWTRIVTVALGAIALASVGAPAVGTPAVGTEASVPPDPCPDGDVTVVVDFTDLGGDVEIGCATDAPTGTAALTSAGFVDARDATGMICAIDSLPDPCPATFTGDYWSYWYAQDGAWQASTEGSDTAVPVPGGVEGWRYSDGSAAPGTDPASPAATGDAAATQRVIATMPEADGTSPWIAVVGITLIAAVLALVTRLVRRGSSVHGPRGQD